MRSLAGHRFRWTLLAFAGVLVAAYAVYLIAEPSGSFFTIAVGDVAYELSFVLVAAVCLSRGLQGGRRRPAWLLLATGIAMYAAADTGWTVAYANAADPPPISLADIGYLGFYISAYIALLGFMRGRVSLRRVSPWLDGLVPAAAVGALASTVVIEQVQRSLGGASFANLVNLAYPLGDALFLALVLAALATGHIRVGRMWGCVAGGLVILGVSDSIYLVLVAHGSYAADGIINLGWPVGILMLGLAALQPAPTGQGLEEESHRGLVIPVTFGLIAVGLLMWDHQHRLSGVTIALACLSVLAMAARLGLTYGENVRMLIRIREDALSDQLTSLGNRRRFVLDLERRLREGRPHVLVLYDLNGFKSYNDTFGHPAGDALLAQLGRRLAAAATDAHGRAYRMGGDEFCVLLSAPYATPEALAKIDEALRAHGGHFDVHAASGRVDLPGEADSSSEALRIADARMYANKHGHRGSAGRQTTDALVTAIQERSPELDNHLRGVTGLARLVALALDLGEKEVQDVVYAAELHDIGKIAIPDSILGKPEPLDEHEWEMMHSHTIIGERIVGAAPALGQAAKLVRSSHERFDGGGYPDGLAGDEIPVGSRIIAVCDAFDAMTSGRPYRDAVSPAAAVAEILACAGSQFDPRVVAAAADLMSRAAEPASPEAREATEAPA